MGICADRAEAFVLSRAPGSGPRRWRPGPRSFGPIPFGMGTSGAGPVERGYQHARLKSRAEPRRRSGRADVRRHDNGSGRRGVRGSGRCGSCRLECRARSSRATGRSRSRRRRRARRGRPRPEDRRIPANAGGEDRLTVAGGGRAAASRGAGGRIIQADRFSDEHVGEQLRTSAREPLGILRGRSIESEPSQSQRGPNTARVAVDRSPRPVVPP